MGGAELGGYFRILPITGDRQHCMKPGDSLQSEGLLPRGLLAEAPLRCCEAAASSRGGAAFYGQGQDASLETLPLKNGLPSFGMQNRL